MSRRTRVLSVSVLLLIVLTLLATRFNVSTMSTIIHRTQTPTQTETTPASFPKTSVTPLNQTLEPNEVVWITMTGGLPSQKTRKVLFAERDSDTINKIVTLVNSTYKTEFIASDYGDGKAIGYPVGIIIKLKNGSTWDIEPLFKVTTRKVLNGTESTATAYNDRVHLRIESNSKQEDYTLLSEQMANYVFEGSKTDMPSVTEFSSTPDTIVPGQKVYISGDGATAKDVLVYIGDGDSNSKEHYLIGKVSTSFGAWTWEGTVNGRALTTLDGQKVYLEKDRYYFEVQISSTRISRTVVNLST